MSTLSESKFNSTRASEYAVQSRIALAGYDACHELAACLLTASLGRDSSARILVVGAGGTAQEILVAGRLEPNWRFTAVDPSPAMLAGARASLDAAGLGGRTDFHLGVVEDLATNRQFDAATLIGVLHHLPGAAAKKAILDAVAARLKLGAPLIMACNRHRYESQPLFLSAWSERWRMNGVADEEIESKLGKILQGADPPASDADIDSMLAMSGFDKPALFFSSLFWGGWITKRKS